MCPRPVQNSNNFFFKHPFGSISSCSAWFVAVWDLSNTVANNKNSCIQYMIGYCVTINSNINSSYTITYRSKRENNSNGINIQWDHKSSSETYGHMDLHWGELKGPFLWKLNGYCKCAGDILVEMSSLLWLWQEYVVTKIFGNIFLALPRRGGVESIRLMPLHGNSRGNNKKVKPKTKNQKPPFSTDEVLLHQQGWLFVALQQLERTPSVRFHRRRKCIIICDSLLLFRFSSDCQIFIWDYPHLRKTSGGDAKVSESITGTPNNPINS